MGWPLRKILSRGTIPAAIFLVAWTTRDLMRRGEDESVINVVLPIGVIILLLWLGASIFWWLVSRTVTKRTKQD